MNIAENLLKIADASRREDGSDIPLGEQLREAAARISELEAALAPFAEAADSDHLCGSEFTDEWEPYLHRNYRIAEITLGDLRRARTLLGGKRDG